MATNDTERNPFLSTYDGQNMEPHEYDINVKFVVFMLCVFSVVGVVGNAIAFYIFCGRRSTSTSVIFILALAGVDFFTCLVTIPYTIVFELVKYELVYDAACKFYMFLITSIQPFSAYIMVGIALDRYFCICHPFLYVFTVPRAQAVVLCMAIPALIFGIITALSHGMYIYELSVLNANGTRVLIELFTDKGEAYRSVDVRNATDHPLISYVHYHQCVNNTYIFSKEFLHGYKQFHAMNFVLAYISVAVLYILIYKSIFTRRVKKAKRKKSNLYPTSSNKTKDNTGEETQMTAINGCSINNPKSLNNQMRKDAKYARKITLTARNDPSVFGQSETVTKSVSGLSGFGLLAQEPANTSIKYNDVLRNGNVNESSPCLYPSSKSKGFVAKETGNAATDGLVTREQDTVYVGPVSYEKDNVYIGPEGKINDIVYIGPLTHEEVSVNVDPRKSHEESPGQRACQDKDTVYTVIRTYEEKDTVSRGPQNCLESGVVYTGPNVYQDNDTVYTGPETDHERDNDKLSSQSQTQEKKDTVYSGSQIPHVKDTVYTCPEICQEQDTVYTGLEVCQEKDNIYTPLQAYRDEQNAKAGPNAYPENVGIYHYPPSDNTSSLVETKSEAEPETSRPYNDPWNDQGVEDVYCGQTLNTDPHHTSRSPVFSIDGTNTHTSSHSDDSNLTKCTTCEPAKSADTKRHFDETDKSNVGQSKNEFKDMPVFNKTNYQDKYEAHYAGDDDTTPQGFCSDGRLPEEKPLLESLLHCTEASQVSHEAKSSKTTLAVSLDNRLPGEDRGNVHSSPKQTPVADVQDSSMRRKRQGTFRDRHLMANIKTALMLFIVTLVFIIAYLPALLMANELISFNIIGFYIYFVYNVANPFIYAFMNHTFREDLKKLIKVCKS
ncbi:hypothetical protein BsWGS_26083 [Bradybaena similaris]